MIYVTKADGRKQPFDKSKVFRTCLRMHATPQQAKAVADKVASKVYEGIPTRDILKLIFTYMKQYRPEVEHEIDLREAISLLRPKPDFEQFVALLLKAQGYDVQQNRIVQGFCIEHEIDAIARKGREIIYVEVKHHYNHHTYTGLGVFLQANSAFEDLKQGYKAGKNDVNFTKALVICNTKVSEHAKRYAECRGIMHVGWKYPPDGSLEQMIEKNKLYPITFLKGLDRISEEKLADNGIILLKQFVESDIRSLWKKTGIPMRKLKVFAEKAKAILGLT